MICERRQAYVEPPVSLSEPSSLCLSFTFRLLACIPKKTAWPNKWWRKGDEDEEGGLKALTRFAREFRIIIGVELSMAFKGSSLFLSLPLS